MGDNRTPDKNDKRSDMGHSPRILVCEHDEALRIQLARKLESAGFWVDTAGNARQALRQLECHSFDAMTLSLLLADQDSITFLHDLSVLGVELPILVTSMRTERATTLPTRLAAQLDVDLELDDDGTEPEWVRKAADQARIIFAIKTACQRSRSYQPRILHIEPDAFNAGLVNAALNRNCTIEHVSGVERLPDALCAGPFDVILLNPSMDQEQSHSALQQVSWAFPGVPIVLQSQYAFTPNGNDIHPIDNDTGSIGLGLIEALRQRVLYNMDVPDVAHA